MVKTTTKIVLVGFIAFLSVSAFSVSASFAQVRPTPTPNPTATPPPVLPAPTLFYPNAQGPTCSIYNPARITFSWSKVNGAASYIVRIDDTTNGWNPCGSASGPLPGDICISNVRGTSLLKLLPTGRRYNWWVSAVSASGTQGVLSQKVSFVPTYCYR